MNKEESKETLRARMQEELQALDPEDRRGRSLQICNHVLELPVWKQARVVVVFEPFKYEPEITPLISDLQRRGSEIIAILPTARSQHDVAIFGPIDLVAPLSSSRIGLLSGFSTALSCAPAFPGQVSSRDPRTLPVLPSSSFS